MSSAQYRGSLMSTMAPGSRLALTVSTAGLLFVGLYAQASDHAYACSCLGCSTISAGDSTEIELLQLQSRWSSTATDGSTGSRGDAITLTWGFATEGSAITPAISGESRDRSDLIARLDTIYSETSGSDLTQSSWFDEFEDSYGRWGEISGLTFVYEAFDDKSNLASGSSGSLGSVADMRIGGHDIDGDFGTLAYNYFPNGPSGGNMVIDTSDTFYTNTGSDSIRLRNTLMHEVGHGIGIRHLESSNSNQLMEPFINTSFYGPQHDDILSVQRYYGDALEKGGGNDTTSNATSLGTFTGMPATFSIGTDADDNKDEKILITESDFISIDGTSDTDIFSFTLSGGGNFNVSILMDPKGPLYNEGPQGGSQTARNTKELADLELELLDSVGSVLLTANANGVGLSELINTFLDPGDYFARVSTASGSDDNVQMYRLDVAAKLVGDVNLDGAVDFIDLNFLLGNYNGPTTGMMWADGDFDGDGDVAFTDLNLLLGNYNAGASPEAILSQIPEPNSLALFTLGGLLIAPRRRKEVRPL